MSQETLKIMEEKSLSRIDKISIIMSTCREKSGIEDEDILSSSFDKLTDLDDKMVDFLFKVVTKNKENE